MTSLSCGVAQARGGPLDPRGEIHVPIGIANTLDTLKTFVEAEGCFSPGFGSYGIYFWVYDAETGKLTAPTMRNVKCARGLGGAGYLIPWSSWRVGDLEVRTEVCEVRRASPLGEAFVVGARAQLTHRGKQDRHISLYVALRPLGPAGWPVAQLAVADTADALLVDGHAAIVADEKPSAIGVLPTDTVGEMALAGKMPAGKKASSERGECSGALRFDLKLAAGQKKTLGFVCPVLPGRRAVGHQWDGKSTWAQLDLARPNPAQGGALQPDPGIDYYRALTADQLFKEAVAYWRGLVGRATARVPDPRWGECFAAVVGHVALCMNDGAPDVAVVNYNVFNRDGVYTANILQKAGHFALAAEAIDCFLAHPFSGRVYPEADNPGQILWIMGEHWSFTRDKRWLERVHPGAQKLAALTQYYRTAKGPHWVSLDGLDFGEALPAKVRKQLKPGRCDGHHPEYTEAFDIVGLRAAAMLAKAAGHPADAAQWRKLADSLSEKYDKRFGTRLPRGYGSYAVLWPCRLYPLDRGKGHEQFGKVGARRPGGWRYFPLATAHQGLLAGSRKAGHATIEAHLDHEQMRGWYVFDEGGRSGPGGWRHVRTTWKAGVAMPHGWAIAELWLLLRDSLLFEDGQRLVLLAGIDPRWFRHEQSIAVERLATHFGVCSLTYAPTRTTATLKLSGEAAPPGGFVLRLPQSLKARATADGKPLTRAENGDLPFPVATRQVRIEFLD